MKPDPNPAQARRRLFGRWFALAVAVGLALGVRWTEGPLAIFSPFIALAGALTGAVTTFALFGLPILVLSILHPRWFCRHACPVGLLQETVRKLRPSAKPHWFHWPFIGRWFALLTLGGAAVGYPFFLWLDPLAIFNGFFSIFHSPFRWAAATAGVMLPVALIFELLWPHAWCMRVCPLGAIQELLVVLRRRFSPASAGHSHWSLARRSLLFGFAGAAAGYATRLYHKPTPPPLRPPGAAKEDKFAGLCVRCGNCIQVCPSHILTADTGAHGLAGLLAPVMRFEDGYCKETCNRCNLVCPTGAIARLTLQEKRVRVIGRAVLNLDTCWLANDRECTACIRACPFEAIIMKPTDGFSSQPAVDLSKCTGCGACEVICPVRPQRAIVVAA